MTHSSASEFREKLISLFGSRVRENERLSKHTTFGIGGPADLFVEVRTVEEMVAAVNLCEEFAAEYFMLGGGSNLLVSDDGYRGTVIKSKVDHFLRDRNNVTVGSGHNLESFVDRVCSLGLGGIEMLAGIKGTVGGAIYGNAGAYGEAISDCFVSANILKPGGVPRVEKKNYFEFSYRNSILKRVDEVVLEVNFQFEDGSVEHLLKRKREILEDRERKHPKTDCSAGCFFKNIEKSDEQYGKLSAGSLLEQVGAKEIKIGKAAVFPGHANILVNLGDAKAEDIKELAMILKNRVKDRFGYILEEEVTYLGNFS